MAKGRGQSDYPTLSGLFVDLTRMEKVGVIQSGSATLKGGAKIQFTRGRQIGRLNWPGVGDFWLDRQQQEVVAVLMEAYFECDVPDVPDATLLRAIESKENHIAKVFRGTDAYGKLVVKGKRPGTSRLAAPAVRPAQEADDDQGDDDQGERVSEPDE